MNNDEKKLIQNTLNRRLSCLADNPFLARQVIATAQGKETKMKKKLSASVVFVLIATLLAATALAAGLLFSPRYNTAKLANEALKNKYGITDKMMTVLCRTAASESDGSTVYTYGSAEHIARMGVYTVTVKDGKAEAVWSLDGIETAGGLEAKAWGAEQLEMMLSDYPAVMTYLSKQQDAYTDEPRPAPSIITEEEQAIAKAKSTIQVLEAAKITLEQARKSARLAIIKEYNLSTEQERLLYPYDGEEYFKMEEGKPLFSQFYILDREDGGWVEKNGIYVVTVNMETGEIEEIIYDSTLAGNG
jgi:hypothetical protein